MGSQHQSGAKVAGLPVRAMLSHHADSLVYSKAETRQERPYARALWGCRLGLRARRLTEASSRLTEV